MKFGMQKLSSSQANKLFWYVSIVLAVCLLIVGWKQRNIIYTSLALVIGILFRYFGNDSLFSELDNRMSKKFRRERF